MLTARIRNRPKPKRDGERKYKHSVRVTIFHCCSILSDRKVTQKMERRKQREKIPFHFSFFTITSSYGGVAQLGEHLPCKQGVKGSIPFISTNGETR